MPRGIQLIQLPEPPNTGSIHRANHPPIVIAGARLDIRGGSSRYFATSIGTNPTSASGHRPYGGNERWSTSALAAESARPTAVRARVPVDTMVRPAMAILPDAH